MIILINITLFGTDCQHYSSPYGVVKLGSVE